MAADFSDSAKPVRELLADDHDVAKPIYAVWEITMRCDQPCQHCGSRAGKAREQELSTEKILEVAGALTRMGCREVALIGGEAYLRDDLPQIVRALTDGGIRVVMQTGGRGVTDELARTLHDAGMQGVGFSIDGPPEIHDRLRGNQGSQEAALRGMDACRNAGLVVSANTQINRLNAGTLPIIADTIRAHGAVAWQVQLTVPMGRAADHPEWILEPWRVVEVVDALAAIQVAALEGHTEGTPFNVVCGNNIGYYGPHEQLLRSRPGGEDTHWQGCRAGINTIGIESDGTIKACPSLPTAPYVGGNVLELSLETIWADSPVIRFARDRGNEELWGHCATCYYGESCRGGCSWMAHCALGKRGNNPFCYYRVKKLQRGGLRERLVQRERAPRAPYDFARFELVEESWSDEPEPPATTDENGARRLPLIS